MIILITSGHLKCESTNESKVGKLLHCDLGEWNMEWVNFVEGSVFACFLLGECMVGSAFRSPLREILCSVVQSKTQRVWDVVFEKFVQCPRRIITSSTELVS